MSNKKPNKDGQKIKSFCTSVSYHKSAPYFIDEFKLEIPANLTPDHHLFFTFYHISVKEGHDSIIGYSWLPLLDANQQITSTTISLPVCVHPPPTGYGRVGPDVNLPGVKWYDNRKALFNVNVRVDSTIHILDKAIHIFSKHLCAIRELCSSPNKSFCTVAGKRIPATQLSESLCTSIRNLSQVSKISNVMKHLHFVMDSLLYLIISPPANDRIIIAQCAFATVVNLVDKIHQCRDFETDSRGINIELEKFVYFTNSKTRIAENDKTEYEGTLGRKSWIRHTMATRNKRPSNMVRHSSYTEAPAMMKYVQSNSDSDLQEASNSIEKQETAEKSDSPRNSSKDQKLLHEELIFQIVVCPNLRDMTLKHMWFYLELISKSITQDYLETRMRLSSRCFDDLVKLCELVIHEINQKHMIDPDSAARLNSCFSFFLRDLIGILSNDQFIALVNSYTNLTSETIKVHPNLNVLKERSDILTHFENLNDRTSFS